MQIKNTPAIKKLLKPPDRPQDSPLQFISVACFYPLTIGLVLKSMNEILNLN